MKCGLRFWVLTMMMKNVMGIRIIAATIIILLLASCPRQAPSSGRPTVDALLIGAGVMSATLASLLHELDPELSIEVYERLDNVALESTAAINNAGTGHQSYSELNYTPELPDGSIDIKKAIDITESFELSKQYWAYLVEENYFPSPRIFINSVPHMSLVFGDTNLAFLKKRYEAMVKHPFYFGMEYTENPKVISEWAPLVMEGRTGDEKIAATRMKKGVDVDFGALTRHIFDGLKKSKNTRLFLSHDVVDLVRNDDATWSVVVKNLKDDKRFAVNAKFVFIGAGGASLLLLQKSGIPEAKAYGGFPVGGAFLVSDKPELVARQLAKVYGKASVGTPPMSVPHLDTRFIDGKRALLFGPFATYSTKFLKHGSWLDLPMSVTTSNFIPMLEVGFHNMSLVRYLVGQLLMTENQRLAALQEYFPNAQLEDFRPTIAGQRVQVIKNDPEKGGILQFGTEMVSSKDGSMVALLGASPGASIAVKAMMDVIAISFKDRLTTASWQQALKHMMPSYGQKLSDNPLLFHEIEHKTKKLLQLEY